MHKKLEAELISLAHSVLQMKNKDEVIALRDKARAIYEKLSVLAFVDEYLITTPNADTSKEDILNKIEETLNIEKPKNPPNKIKKEIVTKVETKDAKSKKETFFEPKFEAVKIDIKGLKSNQISSKEEFRDAISADKTATLFDDSDNSNSGKKTLNDKLHNKTITVGLNDRIAFVNNLFNHNQSDFNRVLSQLNTFKTEKEAKDFIKNKVKSDYDWSDMEQYEERLIILIERKFS